MKTILAQKSSVLCTLLFSVCLQSLAGSFDSKYLKEEIGSSLTDTSSMFYYSFQHQKTIKFEDLLSDSDISYIQTCVGRELVLTAPNHGKTAEYSWEGPNGFTSHLPELKFEEIQLKHDGVYIVNVIKDGLTVLGKIKLIVKPMPDAKVNKSIFREDEAIQLQASDTMLNAKYEWRGTDKKIVSKSKDLWISPKKKGAYDYFLTVNKDGCEVSKLVQITVGTESSKPIYNNTVDVLRHSYK